MEALLLVGLIVLLLILRQNLIVILFVVGGYIHLVWGAGQLEYMIQDMWTGADKEVLLSIPLFILCGNVMTRGSIAERLIGMVSALTAPLPGGMAAATILSCAVFAAISGSSTVTLLAVGTVMYPALVRAGYSRGFAMGALCAGGTLGIIIPPSIPMILYGISTEGSITDLFVAGIIPGLLLTGALTGYALFINRHMPRTHVPLRDIPPALAAGASGTLRFALRALAVPFALLRLAVTPAAAMATPSGSRAPGWRAQLAAQLPELPGLAATAARMPPYFRTVCTAMGRGIFAAALPVILLGGIYTGWFTATESAAIALAYALLVEVFIHRELKLADFYSVAVETTKLLGSLFPILAIALSLNLLLAEQRVPQALVDWMLANVGDKATYLIGVNILLLIVGCFMDGSSAILILAPLLWPIAEAFGIDKIHFGIMMTVNLEIGFLTPPVGLNLIVAMTAFRESFGFICRSVVPFILLMIAVLVLIVWIPELSLALLR